MKLVLESNFSQRKIFRGFYLEFSYSWASYYHINNMKTLLCLTLVSLVIAPGFSSTCPLSSSSQPKLYSDAVGLSSQSNNNGSTAQNLVYNYQFDSPFSSTPAVAIGFNEIQASSSPVLDIRVSNPRTTTSGIYFQAQSE